MMKDILDVHTHTIASVHAYSTIREMAEGAKRHGMKLIGISDHGPAMPGTMDDMYFCNFRVVPREAAKGYGIDVLMGAELNVIDYAGSTDLCAKWLSYLDYAIASLHDLCITPGTREQNTSALIGAMRNPKVKIIGHPDNPAFEVDFKKLAKAAKENHVLLEVNNSSYNPKGSRPESRNLAGEYLAAAKAEGAMMIIGSDAHIEFDAGNHEFAHDILKTYDFPEELIINSDVGALKEWIKA